MKKAIVLSAFGSSNPAALQPFLDTIKEVEKAFPACEVRLAFTSPTIRGIWHKRAKDKAFQTSHPEIPVCFYTIQTPLSVLADLQEKGYREIIVQPLYIVEGSEFYDLRATVSALRSITPFRADDAPFPKLALGRPFLGMNSARHDYHQDIHAMAEALKDDATRVASQGLALVYAGHGNPNYATPAYTELETKLREQTNTAIFFATLEGWPDISTLLPRLQEAKIKNILLRPFLFAAGKHANEDIAGDKKDSWENMLRKNGFDVQTELTPIGALPQVRRLLVQHVLDAAADEKIDLP